MYTDKELEQFDYWQQKRPEHLSHNLTDTEEKPLGEQLTKLKPTNWRQRGNKLIADTEFGELVQFIPTDMLLTGENDGKPTFTKIKT